MDDISIFMFIEIRSIPFRWHVRGRAAELPGAPQAYLNYDCGIIYQIARKLMGG